MTTPPPHAPEPRPPAPERPLPEGAPPEPSGTQSPRPELTALHSPRAWLALLLPLAGSLTLDLWSKAWAFRTIAGAPVELRREEIVDNPAYRLPIHDGVRVLPWDLLDFHLVLNHGAVFGIGDGRRLVFVTFTIVAVAVALWVFAKLTAARDTWAHIGLGLILAGGVGNLVDRIMFGAVRDFLHMLPRWNLPFGLRWPGGNDEVFPWVFNVADVSLLTGMAILLFVFNRNAPEPPTEPRAPARGPERTAPASTTRP